MGIKFTLDLNVLAGSPPAIARVILDFNPRQPSRHRPAIADMLVVLDRGGRAGDGAARQGSRVAPVTAVGVRMVRQRPGRRLTGPAPC